MLRAASTWQEVSMRNNKKSSLPGLGREEESMARKSFLWTLQVVSSSSDLTGRDFGNCAVTEWGKEPIPTLLWETLAWGKLGEAQASFQLFSSPLVTLSYLASSEVFSELGTVTLNQWLYRLKEWMQINASYHEKSHIRELNKWQ